MPRKKKEVGFEENYIELETKEAEVVIPQVNAPSEQEKMSYGQNP